MKLVILFSLIVILAIIFIMWFISRTRVKNIDRQLPTSESEGIFYTTSDGMRIFVYTYLPEGNVSTSVYILSGITGINHIREKDIIELLSDGKNRIVVIHPRGTGYSGGKRGDTEDFSKFFNDYVEIVNSDIMSRKSSDKVILYGHSMSTAVVLNVAEKITRIDGTILINPPYKMKDAKGMTPSIGEYIKYAFYYIFMPHTPVVNMAGDSTLISNEEERKEAETRGKDPLLVKYFSMYYMTESKKMMDAIIDKAKKSDYPLLLVYGTSDSIIEKSGCDEIFAAWKNPEKKYELIENGPHGKLTVYKAIEKIHAWISGL